MPTTVSDNQVSNEAKHTPGPWRVHHDEDDEECWVELDDNEPGHAIVAVVEEQDESVANAHLIAAAPDLLEALKAAKQFLSIDISRGPASNGWVNTVDMVNAAIAKAEGQ